MSRCGDVFEPENLDEAPSTCVEPPDHPGDHRDARGRRWARRPGQPPMPYKHEMTDDERAALAGLLARRVLSPICHHALDRFVNERVEGPPAAHVVTFTAVRVVRGLAADNTIKHTLDALRDKHAQGCTCVGMYTTDEGLVLFFRAQTTEPAHDLPRNPS